MGGAGFAVADTDDLAGDCDTVDVTEVVTIIGDTGYLK